MLTLTPEEMKEALAFNRGESVIHLQAPSEAAVRPTLFVAAVRLYYEDRTLGGAACAALLWPKLRRRARVSLRPTAEWAADALDALLEDGWKATETAALGERAAGLCGMHVQQINADEAEAFS